MEQLRTAYESPREPEQATKLFVENQVSSIWKQVFFATFPVSGDSKTHFFEFLAKNLL